MQNNKLSKFDLLLIRKLCKTKSFAELAVLMDKPEPDIPGMVEQAIAGMNIITKQRRLDLKADQESALKRKHQRKRGMIAMEKRSKTPANKPPVTRNDMKRGPLHKTKQVDYSTHYSLKIDKRTTIMVPPGVDPQKARENYLNKYSKTN